MDLAVDGRQLGTGAGPPSAVPGGGGAGPQPHRPGRSGSKLHLQVEQHGLPVAIMLTGAHVHDSRLVTPTVQAAVIQSPVQTACPRHLCLDKGYDYARVELEVVDLGYTPHIRRIGEERSGGTRATEETHPARRWVVERTFAWLKGFRETEPNELLEVTHGERLDPGTVATASGGDPAMATVGAVNRPQD